jgi:hypothetical protein
LLLATDRLIMAENGWIFGDFLGDRSTVMMFIATQLE